LHRWAQFRLCVDEVDKSVTALGSKEAVNTRIHVGGGYYVSVTSGFQCVDMRRFYLRDGKLKPTREGVALRLSEWTDLCGLMQTISDARPKLGAAIPCYLAEDHQNQLGWLECIECNPFGPAAVFLEEFEATAKLN